MKLRAYTPYETDELLMKFKTIAEYAYSINRKSYNFLLDQFNKYNCNFKPSIFKWKANDFKTFISNLDYSNKSYIYNFDVEDEHYNDLLIKDLFKKSGDFIIVDWKFSFTCKNKALNLEQITMITDASSVTQFMLNNHDLRDTYRILKLYAHRPFEFDLEDIKWLDNIEFYYKKALEWKSN